LDSIENEKIWGDIQAHIKQGNLVSFITEIRSDTQTDSKAISLACFYYLKEGKIG
jgi:hypothetical protein